MVLLDPAVSLLEHAGLFYDLLLQGKLTSVTSLLHRVILLEIFKTKDLYAAAAVAQKLAISVPDKLSAASHCYAASFIIRTTELKKKKKKHRTTRLARLVVVKKTYICKIQVLQG